MAELDDVTFARARRGDRLAQAALIRHYEKSVFRLLYRLRGRDTHRVEDLAQETFLRALRRLEHFDPHGPARFSTWLLGIGARLAIDDERRAQRARAQAARVPPEAPRRPDAIVSARQLGARVAHAMGALPEEQRAALILRAYHDLDYREIAEQLECEVGTVKSRIARARMTLRRAIEEPSAISSATRREVRGG